MDRLLRMFNIKEAERSRALLLFFYQFFVVASLVQGRIIRDTLFLKRYDVSQLPLMYIGFSAIVPLLTYLYTKKSNLFRLDKLIKLVLLFASIMTLGLIALIKMGFVYSYPMLYLFVEVAGSFMMFQFWSFANELFDSREAKRVLGFVGGGGVLASLSAGLGVRNLVVYFSIENILFLNVFYMLVCLIIVHKVGGKYKSRLQKSVGARSAEKLNKSHTDNVMKSPYVKQIALITAFIFIIVTIVDYQFKIAAQEHFNEKDLAVFFGAIYAIFGGVFSFFFQFFLISRLLKIGIFFSLAILPAMVTGFSFLYLLVPGSIIFITMARASDYSFRYTINDAAMQLLYIPLHHSVRQKAKAIIDGIIKPFFVGLSGFAIFFLKWKNVDSDLLTLSVVVLGILWLVVIFLIRSNYISVLIDNIKRKKIGNEEIEIRGTVAQSIIIEAISSNNDDEILMALDMVERNSYFRMAKYFVPLLKISSSPQIKTKILRILRMMESRIFTHEILKLMQDQDSNIVKEAILTYGYTMMDKSIKYTSSFLDHDDLKVHSAAIIALIKYGGISGIMIAAPYLKDLLFSEVSDKRAMAAYVIGEVGQNTMRQQLFSLLTDEIVLVRRESIKACTKMGSNEFIPHLFFMLMDKDVNLDAAKAIATFGESAIGPSDDILRNNIDSFELKYNVAKMLGNIRSPKSIQVLMASLNDSSEQLRNVILISLKRLNKQELHGNLNVKLLEKYLFKEFYLYFQFLYYIQTVKKSTDLPYLISVIEEKQKECYSRIFNLLGLLYGSEVFDTIFFNVTQPTVSKQQKSSAIEIIDNIVEKDVRKILIPLIELKEREALMELGFKSFKIEVLSFNEILEAFLMDDNAWVRSITLFLVASEKIMSLSNRIRMFMYDPSPLTRETALYATYELGLKIQDEDLNFLFKDTNRNVVGFSNHIVSLLKKKRGENVNNS